MHGMVLVLWEVGAILENGYIWNSGTKLCCISSREWKASRVSLQEFDIRYIIIKVTQFECISVV